MQQRLAGVRPFYQIRAVPTVLCTTMVHNMQNADHMLPAPLTEAACEITITPNRAGLVGGDLLPLCERIRNSPSGSRMN